MIVEEEKQNLEDQNLFNGFDLTSMENMVSLFDNGENNNSDGLEAEEEEQEQPELDLNINDLENQEQEQEDPSSQDNPENTSSIYTAIAKSLAEDGLLLFEENTELKTAEDLLGVFKQNFQASIEQYKESLDPRVKWLQDNIEQGVPLETLLQMDKDKITYSSIDEESLSGNSELQKTIVRDFYKRTTKFSDERIQKEINRLDDLGELDNESKSYLSELKSLLSEEEQLIIQQAQAQQAAALKAQEEVVTNFKKTLESTVEVIPGVPLTNIVKDKVWKIMTTPVAKDQYGNDINAIGKHKMENPIDFELKLAAIYEYTKGFTDFSVFNNSAKKTAIKELEQAAGRMDLQKSSTSTNNPRMPKTSAELLKGMQAFMK